MTIPPDQLEAMRRRSALLVALMGGGDLVTQLATDLEALAAEVERLQSALEHKPGSCRILSEGDACDCTLCKQSREIERLNAIIGTIINGAEWCGWHTKSVSCNVTLWNLPQCDGRNGTLLECAEKARRPDDPRPT